MGSLWIEAMLLTTWDLGQWKFGNTWRYRLYASKGKSRSMVIMH
jgi:hypothetical protein